MERTDLIQKIDCVGQIGQNPAVRIIDTTLYELVAAAQDAVSEACPDADCVAVATVYLAYLIKNRCVFKYTPQGTKLALMVGGLPTSTFLI